MNTWIDTAFLTFPWIGGIGAIVLLALLFGTRLLQSEPSASRWRDRVWLSWLAVVVYLIHNVEEYGIDLAGHRHGFPDGICSMFNFPAFPDCPIPPLFFLSVNIPLIWIGAPIAALLSRRHPFIGFAFYSVIFVNALVHLAPFLAGTGYNSGLVTAIVLFLPMSAWTAYALFGAGRWSYKVLALFVALGIVFHVILMVPIQLFVRDMIGSGALIWVQMVNAVLLFVLAWLGEKWRGGALLRPVT